jgi:hypothetical protein
MHTAQRSLEGLAGRGPRAKQVGTKKGKLLFDYGFGRPINYACTTASGASAAERRNEQACRVSKKAKPARAEPVRDFIESICGEGSTKPSGRL